MPIPRVIGLMGDFGSGKSEVAKIVSKFGLQKRSFAGALREEIEQTYESNEFQIIIRHAAVMGHDQAAFDLMLLERVAVNGFMSHLLTLKPTPPFVRRILQWWGTEYRRKMHPDHWVSRLRPYLLMGNGSVIDDVRFHNEAALVRELGGELWWIDRDDLPADPNRSHVSEREWKSIVPDRVILNNRAIEDLEREVAWIMGEYQKEAA